MSELKFSPNVFLGVQEWSVFQENVHNSIKRNLLINSDRFGIVRQLNIPEIGNIDLSTSFYVGKSGTPFDEVIINEGVAIDSYGNFIINPSKKNIKIPADGVWYSIVISYDFTHREKGTISVDSNGVVTGVNTEFTKCLRGFGEFNSKVRFLDTKLGNSREYEVAKIVNDTTMVLVGDFISESNLQFGVYGTFLDGYQVPEEDKMIFKYDYFRFDLYPSGDDDLIIPDKQFLIAKVVNNGIDVTVEDVRKDWWKSEAMSYLKDINRFSSNVLLGIDSVKYDVETSPKDENLVQLSWNFKCSSYTIDTNSKKISILIGEGGLFKDTSYFTSGDFNGWRVYASNGSFITVLDSQKTGTQIVLTMDILNPTDFPGIDSITIVPPFEGIEFKVEGEEGDLAEKVNEVHYFNIYDEKAILKLKVTKPKTFYNLRYRYKIYNDYTSWKMFKKDEVGYYDENSFDLKGNLNENIIDRKRITYEPEVDYFFVELTENKNSFHNTIVKLDTGDLFGVNKTSFKNENPLISLFVGTDKRYQHFGGDENEVLTLSADMTIVLNNLKADGSELRDGNTFFIHLSQFLDLSTFKLRIVQNMEDALTFNELMNITNNDICHIKNTFDRMSRNKNCGIFVTATWSKDWNEWILSYETDQTPIGTMRMMNSTSFPSGLTNYFSNLGVGIKAPYFGWKLKSEYDKRFLRVNNTSEFVKEGTDSYSLTVEQMPNHNHTLTDPGHAHQLGSGDGWGGSGSIGMVKRNQEFWTTANKTGITIASAGGGQPIDNRPAFAELILIEKIV